MSHIPATPDLPRVYWTVPDHYTTGTEFANFPQAVLNARARQVRLDWNNEDGTPAYSRVFVALRTEERWADGGGQDVELMVWEVHPDWVERIRQRTLTPDSRRSDGRPT